MATGGRLMRKIEIPEMFVMIKSLWPKSTLDPKNELQVKFWYSRLKEIDTDVVRCALEKLSDTSRYEPTIADIKATCAEITQERLCDVEEGWGLVQKAIRSYGYMRAEEAMQSLPNEVQEAVKYMGGFKSICEGEVEGENTTRAQFRRCMETVVKRRREDNQTSLLTKTAILQLRALNYHQIEECVEPIQINIERRNTSEKDFECVENVLRELGYRGGE